MKRCYLSILTLFLSISLFASERIIFETDDVTEMKQYCTDETIIFFDLDDVVFTTESYLGHSVWFYDTKEELIEMGLTWNQATEFMSCLDHEVKKILPAILIDERLPLMIRHLQKKHPILGLTSRSPTLDTATFRVLNHVGVDFAHEDSLIAPFSETFSATSKIEGNIIFVSDYHSKGNLVNYTITKLKHLYPAMNIKRVIFIDDKEKYLHEVNDVLPETIDFIGLRYSAEDMRKESLRAYKKSLQH